VIAESAGWTVWAIVFWGLLGMGAWSTYKNWKQKKEPPPPKG